MKHRAVGTGVTASVARGVPSPGSRTGVLILLLVLLGGWTLAAWPRLLQPFTAASPVVDALDVDVLYDGVGLTAGQLDGVRGAIGDRPIAFAFLADEDPRRNRDLCAQVTRVLSEVQFVVVRGGRFAYACTGDDVPVTATGELRGAGYEIELGAALDLLEDPVAQAQAAALVHDSLVRRGLLADTERQLRTSWTQVLRTLGIVIGVLVAVGAALYWLRGMALRALTRRRRAAELAKVRDDLDDALSELALVIVGQSPADPRRPAPAVAVEYATLIEQARTARGGWRELLDRAAVLLAHAEGSLR